MSACKQLEDYKPKLQRRVDTTHDLTKPLVVEGPLHKAMHLQEADDSYNAYLLRERESHGKRTTIKISFEVYARKSGGNLDLCRLRNMGCLVSCPDGRQAQLVMDAVERVVESLHGKLLVAPPKGS
jgi:hypothetical protein